MDLYHYESILLWDQEKPVKMIQSGSIMNLINILLQVESPEMMHIKKQKNNRQSYDTIRQLGIESKKQLEQNQVEIDKSPTFDISLNNCQSEVNSGLQSNTEQPQLEKVAQKQDSHHNLKYNWKNKRPSIKDETNIEKIQRQIHQLIQQENQYHPNSHTIDLQLRYNRVQVQQHHCTQTNQRNQHQEYSTENYRTIVLLTKKLHSNHNIENTQVRMLLKLIDSTILDLQTKQLQHKVKQLSIVCRKLRIESRNSKAKKYGSIPKKSKNQQKQEKSLCDKIEEERCRVNKLSTKIILLQNYIDALRRKPTYQTESYFHVPFSFPMNSRETDEEISNVKQRKYLMKRRIQILKGCIESSREGIVKKISRLKEQNALIRQQSDIIKKNIAQMIKENRKYGVHKVNSLQKIIKFPKRELYRKSVQKISVDSKHTSYFDRSSSNSGSQEHVFIKNRKFKKVDRGFASHRQPRQEYYHDFNQ